LLKNAIRLEEILIRVYVITMIVKLKEKHREEIMEFLLREQDYNLFIIGDVENFGFDTDFQDIWGNFEGGRMTSVLLRYYGFFIYYSPHDEDVSEYVEIIRNCDKFEFFSGKVECVERFIPHISFNKVRKLYLARLNADIFRVKYKQNEVRIATPDDVDGIYELQSKIEEFGDMSGTRERIEQTIVTQSGRIVVFVKQGAIVSSAASTAETSGSAILVAVMTDPQHRGKGLATGCIEKICHELLMEKKSVYIFYDNPSAGKIYKKVGFEDIGRWCIAIPGS